jgi:fructokinase
MNVALHLHQLGLPTRLISAVGKDADGEKLLDFLRSFDLPLDLVQVPEQHPTSQVIVDTRDPENMRYDIVKPVAWDFLAWTPEQDRIVEEADAFLFGTLGARHPESLATLLKLLRHPTLRIFDANLRPPHYSFDVIETLLGYTDILKINEEELEVFAEHFDTEATITGLCGYLDQHFPISIICITRGSKGAAIYQKGTLVEHPGYKVAFQDSIGAGDAFLSGFIKMYLAEKSPEEIIDFACKLGGYVATQKGGAPRYTEEDVLREIR